MDSPQTWLHAKRDVNGTQTRCNLVPNCEVFRHSVVQLLLAAVSFTVL